MARITSVIEEIYSAESPEQLLAEGIDTIPGRAEFVDSHRVRVGELQISFRKLLVATGARPAIPPIPGLEESGYLTYETLWSMTQLPERLLVIGGGPIGCELAQAFNRLGSDVLLLEAADRILPNEEPEASETLHTILSGEGVNLRVSQSISSVGRDGEQFRIVTEGGEWTGDRLLVATGRLPNLAGLELGKAGVEFYKPWHQGGQIPADVAPAHFRRRRLHRRRPVHPLCRLAGLHGRQECVAARQVTGGARPGARGYLHRSGGSPNRTY